MPSPAQGPRTVSFVGSVAPRDEQRRGKDAAHIPTSSRPSDQCHILENRIPSKGGHPSCCPTPKTPLSPAAAPSRHWQRGGAQEASNGVPQLGRGDGQDGGSHRGRSRARNSVPGDEPQVGYEALREGWRGHTCQPSLVKKRLATGHVGTHLLSQHSGG